uniref:Uncharacterized protein n=1 Tax=Globisporangium ultimum (strain ATCC 200006 / CBS 805.95 / DAOM BR144) TaxID=431595 RepID=K3WYI4_GLOUD
MVTGCRAPTHCEFGIWVEPKTKQIETSLHGHFAILEVESGEQIAKFESQPTPFETKQTPSKCKSKSKSKE